MRTAVFVERDGIVNQVRVERLHQVTPASVAEFHLNPGVTPLFQQLKKAGFVLVVTTNQPGLSGGGVSRRELDRMHDLLRRALPVDDILVCPHGDDDRCPCRKPGAGLFTEAAFKWHLDLEHSFVISDKWQDAAAARVVGCTALLLKSPWLGSGHHDFVFENLTSLAEKLLRLHSATRTLAA